MRSFRRWGILWNYLRVRGEYFPAFVAALFTGELPPRARRIQALACTSIQELGTTSACAENTPRGGGGADFFWNYLRVRGEYPISRNRNGSSSELPPRARRIRMEALNNIPPHGTTSACAENTWLLSGHGSPLRNYLRVRGEYAPGLVGVSPERELPPRARRILTRGLVLRRQWGTTSACAENTMVRKTERTSSWNYLRVRGEYTRIHGHGCGPAELPPRARRIRFTRLRQA